MMKTFDPNAKPPEDDPFASIDLGTGANPADTRQDPGFNVPTSERISPEPVRRPHTTAPPPPPAASVPPPRSVGARLPRPPSAVLQAASWLFVVLSAVGAVGGAVFAGWTSEAIDLDDQLMAKAEELLGVRPPLSFTGKDDVSIDAIRREAMAQEAAGDLPSAAVLWQRVIARDPTDSTAKTALPRVQTALGERLR
jgi:hypothetical protein